MPATTARDKSYVAGMARSHGGVTLGAGSAKG